MPRCSAGSSARARRPDRPAVSQKIDPGPESLVNNSRHRELTPFPGVDRFRCVSQTPGVDMKCALLGFLLMGAALDARAVGSLANVQILDRDSGTVLPTYRYHGEYWVAGRPGARYAILIQNHRGERLLAVTAVDGINVITGETGAWSQGGYVFDAGESYEIAGWRKSNAEIAAFNFTAAGQSYAERTGRPANIGVIGVALFLERPVPKIESYAPSFGEASKDSAARRCAGRAE